MKTKVFIFVSLFFLAFFLNCEREKHSCPSCSEEITWDSYGDWILQAEGGNGFSDGRNPVNLVSDCGWSVLTDTTVSGIEVYSVQSCNGGVTFYWIQGKFSSFQVSEEWTGLTKEGIKFGDSFYRFRQAYPYFKYSTDNPPFSSPDTNFVYYAYKPERKLLIATFSRKDAKWIGLYVSKNE